MMIQEYSRVLMIEQVMALYGRSQPNPRAFRSWLESLSQEELAEEFQKATEVLRE